MKLTAKLLLTAGLVFGSVGPAHASVSTVNMVGAEAHTALRAYVQCAVENQRPLAVDFALDQSIATKAVKERKFDKSRCMKSAHSPFLTSDYRSFAGEIAELLLAGRDLTALDVAIPEAPALDLPKLMTSADYRPNSRLSRAEFERQLPEINGMRTFEHTVDCTVRRAPAQARAVFLSDYASTEERAAIDTILPSVSACMKDGRIRMLPMQLRHSLALSYLRLAVAAVPSFKEALV